MYYFLGVEVTRTVDGLHLCQRKYILGLLDWYGLATTKGVPTPMVSSPVLSKHDGVLIDD